MLVSLGVACVVLLPWPRRDCSGGVGMGWSGGAGGSVLAAAGNEDPLAHDLYIHASSPHRTRWMALSRHISLAGTLR